VIVDALLSPMRIGEGLLARMHLKRLKGQESFGCEVVLFDRGYPSFDRMRRLKGEGIRFVLRVRRGFSSAIDALGEGSHRVVLGQKGESLRVRVIVFTLVSGEKEMLITDLQSGAIGGEEFKWVYKQRWSIETKWKELKQKWEIENFSGKVVGNVKQDFYAVMTLSNRGAALREEAQEGVEEEREGKGNEYEYEVNGNQGIGDLKYKLIGMVAEEDEEKRGRMYERIIARMERSVVPVRPNRSVPRKPPRKARFHHNHKSNC
jgi:hypothetical protein